MSMSIKASPDGTYGEILVNGAVVAKLPVTGNAVIPGLVGTVSQSGGVPTGAIIERGSNANGEYVRYADGTQICTVNAALSGVTSTATGGIYTSQDINWTFPATFTTSAIVTGRVRVGTASSWIGLGNNATSDLTSADYAIKSSTAIAASTGLGLCAIGRWY